jgi:hypothetical protein
MVTPFELVIERLVGLGFYEFFFPFLITVAVIYGLLRKSAILGASALLNGVVALSIGFLIFGFPVLAGITLATPFAGFFTTVTVFILIFAMGLLLASFFYPNLQAWLVGAFVRRTTLWVMLGLGIAIFVISGLVNIFIAALYRPPPPGVPAIPIDITVFGAAIVLLIILLLIAVSSIRME